jgi:hypothetical protein
MTDGPTTEQPAAEHPPSEPPTRRAPARKPGPLPTVLAALAVFGVAFEFLAFQLTAGRDPAVGTGTSAGTPAAKIRPAKKLVITRVVPAAGGSTSSYSSSGSVAAPAPVVTGSS